MDKSTKHYWAVFEGREVKFEGGFNDCWKHLTQEYADATVAWLVKSDVRIGRKH